MNSVNIPIEPSQASASLVKRLAGPSTTKAGLSKDQTEINRIIAEASKGSKFYDNEKRKDKDLTARIAKILKKRDECMNGIDTVGLGIAHVENTVDNLIAKMEAQRDLSQIIVHVDMDAFFANVELLYNADLQGKPFAVGQGILTTASYEARKYGVRSGMPGFIAKKLCPELIFVPINGRRYSEMSAKVMNVFRRYDPTMCPSGCDEGFLNITDYCNEHELSADDCVQEMRGKVHQETGLTVSAGIAPNKMLAKICSDKNKPNGQFHLPFNRQSVMAFMHDLSVRKIPGIGRVNERLLESVGIITCGDIYTHRAMLSAMDKEFGLVFLLRIYLGIASNVVQPMQRHERKSIGAERSFDPIGEKEKIMQKLDEVATALEKDMQRSGWTGRTVTLKFKLDTFQVFTRAKSLDRWVMKKEDLYAIGKELLQPELPLEVRLIGLRVTRLKDLRAPSPPGGIKKFFESVNSGSPVKKRKLEFDDDGEDEDRVGEDLALDHEDGDEDSMPGFHELDEDDVELSQEILEEMAQSELETNDDMPVAGPSRPRPPVSAPARTSSRSSYADDPGGDDTRPSTSRASTKPRSAGPIRRSKRDKGEEEEGTADSETHTCPVCGKTLATDNQGLNTHIDFCLSRGVILEAQAEACQLPTRTPSASDDGGGFKWRKKEERKGKRRKG